MQRMIEITNGCNVYAVCVKVKEKKIEVERERERERVWEYECMKRLTWRAKGIGASGGRERRREEERRRTG